MIFGHVIEKDWVKKALYKNIHNTYIDLNLEYNLGIVF